MDRGYTNLLAHLHKASPSLPLTTIQGALAHYLAHLSPLPTPLAASAISSTLYLTHPFTNDKLQSLLTAFRHATHLRYRNEQDDIKKRSRFENLFSKSLDAALGQWIEDVVKGIQGGHPMLRLSSLSGLLLGIRDLEVEANKQQSDQAPVHSLHVESSRNIVEDELIVAVAEIMDTYSHELGLELLSSWEKESRPADVLTLALIIAAQSLPHVSQVRLSILPLATLNQLVLLTLSSTFCGGKFLHELSASTTQRGEYRVFMPPASPVARGLHSIAISPVFTSAASLTRLAASSLRSRLEGYSDSKKSEGLRAASETLQLLLDMAVRLEQDWSTAPLASATEPPDSRPVTQAIWSVLKTMLFSTIMLSDAILASIVYIKPGSSPYIQTSTSSSKLALRVLEILSSFAFIISQFGGVTSSSQGFEQLKKTFYLALDILAQTSNGTPENHDLANSYYAKKALVLASIEQLVPVLSEDYIRDYVFDVCWPHLSDPSHRETFESAHSVTLSVFASRAQRQQRRSETPASPIDYNKSSEETSHPGDSGLTPRSLVNSDFVKKMIPFYAHCLLENSADGRLSTPQLRMAFAAVVRCAAASGLNVDTTPEGLSLSWYCIQLFLDSIHSDKNNGDKGKENEVNGTIEGDMTEGRLHRLRLALISAVPSLPLVLMLRALQEIKAIITSIPASKSKPPILSKPESNSDEQRGEEKGTRDELAKALFQEIMGQVGYREKSAAMHWWYENRMDLQVANLTILPTSEKAEGGNGTAMTAS
ncbi:hypothetical protein D9756_004582 [Leucocoprinus leucothites]|uniref:Uncharacterized protein n=1 Tax=Leucocoprinus leucothites TaxID=201217 RepID=A0A8H5G8V0_9AGAR|nr:hypothetical protein D9756_004582 [Leucoagaricus leucothites]